MGRKVFKVEDIDQQKFASKLRGFRTSFQPYAFYNKRLQALQKTNSTDPRQRVPLITAFGRKRYILLSCAEKLYS